MLGKEKLKAIADRVLALSSADQTEVLILGDDEQLTRFAANVIRQNVSETDVTVRVRSIIGKKVGVASGNDLSDAALKQVVESAREVGILESGIHAGRHSKRLVHAKTADLSVGIDHLAATGGLDRQGASGRSS